MATELTLITKALYTDPYDQALWFYFNLVVGSNLSTEGASRTSISARGPSVSGLQRLLLILEGLQELLEDAADCKWLLEALVHHSMVALRIDSLITDEQKTEGPIEYSGMMHPIDRVGLMRTIEGWIGELHKLDPLRTNRWSHLGRRLAELRANDEID